MMHGPINIRLRMKNGKGKLWLYKKKTKRMATMATEKKRESNDNGKEKLTERTSEKFTLKRNEER